MLRVNIANTSVFIDESWQEAIKHGNYLAIALVLHSYEDHDTAKMALFSYYCRHQKLDLPEDLTDFASMQIIEDVFPTFNYIWEDFFTEPPLPVIQHDGVTYHSLGDKLVEMNGAEMEDAAWANTEYTATENEDLLNHLIAILYNDNRNPNQKEPKSTIEVRAKKLSTLTPLIKQGIRLWYQMCESWWAKEYAVLYEGGEGNTSDSLGVSRLIRSLAGDKRGKVDDVRLLPRDEIYFELTELHRESEERKSHSK